MDVRRSFSHLRNDTLFNSDLSPQEGERKYAELILEELKRLDPENILGSVSVEYEDERIVEIHMTIERYPRPVKSEELMGKVPFSVIAKMQDDEAPKPMLVGEKWMCPVCETVSEEDELEIDLDGCRSCPECGYVLFTPEEWKDIHD